jgi:hypothetical protein
MKINLDQDLNTLIAYSFFGFQDTNLELLLKQAAHKSDHFINLRENKVWVNGEIQACFLGFLAVQEAMYLIYAYIFNNKEYGFAWESEDEESPAHPNCIADPPWFEFIKPGQLFKIRINEENPYQHYITEKPFACMNSPVLKLGTCREVYHLGAGTDDADDERPGKG